MSTAIARIELRYEQDAVYARQRARLVAELLGFDRIDQTRISTALSEIARNAHQYAGGGEVEFALEDADRVDTDAPAPPRRLVITVRDRGPGIADTAAILEGRYRSRTGMGLGIAGARRLMDTFDLETAPGSGTTVRLGKTLPRSAPPVTPQLLARIAEALARLQTESPLQEIQVQNQDLLRALDALRERQEELTQLNVELSDTNRGVLALYTELEDKNVQLAQANRLKAQFLSNMSHEFRTPLNSILAISRLLAEHTDGELTPEQDKQVAFVSTAAADLSGMVNDLLDLAKIESGKIEVNAQDCSVTTIFSGLRGMFKPLASVPEVNLVIEDPLDIPLLYTDEGKVSQILRNFLSNALKFTRRGTIRVHARLAEDCGAAVFSVTDSGIGIAPQDQARIFGEYTQVENAQGGKAKGTGLGLAICRRLAQLLGGAVAVESALGTGSTFSLTIPLRYVGPDAPVQPLTAVALDPIRLPVLVVEDDAKTQALYERYLRNTPFQPVAAYSAEQAKQLLAAVQRPVAIVLDLLMPGQGGLELLCELKQHPEMREIPVIVASVLDAPEPALALGAAQYQMKPVQRAWLLNTLNQTTRDTPRPQALIIDDEEVARYILKDYLAGTRFAVIEAASGAEGLNLARAHKPAVIFLDLTMPQMSGFEVLRELKQDPALRNIPVIINSSKILDEEARRALQAHAVTVLSKGGVGREAATEAMRLALSPAPYDKNQQELPQWLKS